MKHMILSMIVTLALLVACSPAPQVETAPSQAAVSAPAPAESAADTEEIEQEDEENTEEAQDTDEQEDAPEDTDSGATDEEEEQEEDKQESQAESSFSGTVITDKSTPFIEFNEEDYDNALAEGKTVMLLFAANWCPSCQKEHPEAVSGLDQLEADNVVVFRVSYKDEDTTDKEEDLAREFGVTYQGTKVVLKDGEQVLKTQTRWKSDDFVAELETLA